jgi:hypothetical protein
MENRMNKNIDSTIDAANKLIASACLAEYKMAQFNKSGKHHKKHKPYSIPEWCTRMQAIIQTGNEYDIKAAMHAARIGCYELV